jgi:hypothetical protein
MWSGRRHRGRRRAARRRRSASGFLREHLRGDFLPGNPADETRAVFGLPNSQTMAVTLFRGDAAMPMTETFLERQSDQRDILRHLTDGQQGGLQRLPIAS